MTNVTSTVVRGIAADPTCAWMPYALYSGAPPADPMTTLPDLLVDDRVDALLLPDTIYLASDPSHKLPVFAVPPDTVEAAVAASGQVAVACDCLAMPTHINISAALAADVNLVRWTDVWAVHGRCTFTPACLE
jgi:hypothetical protein